ncbi:MAG TPA: hypothetical protein VGX78_18815, partial [Pirellulales bacterium]|nr:hypothetical protein [Pirellulales bacterium]
MTRTLVLLTLLDALPALADNLDQGIVHKASQQQAGHYAKPGPGRSHPAPRVVNVYSTRPGYYSGDDRYSGNRAVYAAYSNAGYGPSGGRRGGYGGGFGGAYNIEMQRLLT